MTLKESNNYGRETIILEGEKMSGLCREFGITRRTGYKIYNSYKECDLEGLNDRSRRPHNHANHLPYQVERIG